MTSPSDVVKETLSLIESADLPYPSGALLASFVTEALSPPHAARYVGRRLSAGESTSIVSDWTYIVECITTQNACSARPLPAPTRAAISRRDGARCCVTGKKGTLWDPLLVLPILPAPSGWVTDQDHISDMLGAFFGAQYRDWWLSHARNPDLMSPYHYHWLVRRSASKAFAAGLLRLDRMQTSMVEYEVNQVTMATEDPIDVDGAYPLLGDHSRGGIEKVDPRFIGTQARLSSSIRFIALAKQFAADSQHRLPSSLPWRSARYFSPQQELSRQKRFSLARFATRGFLAIWLMFPRTLRMAGYGLLRRIGQSLYGNTNSSSSVQRLPFGLYLKFLGEPSVFRNEFNSLRMVREYTTIPVPDALDIVTKSEHVDRPFSSEAYLLMTRVPGLPLSRCLAILSDRDLGQISDQLKDYVAQLRAIPKATNSEMAICNTLGQAFQDPRIRGGQPVGPFLDEAAFSRTLRFSDEPARRGHRVLFTHADLNPRNILIDQFTRSDGSCGWRVTGIVDWETAGYYPEYWDYTKAMFEGFRWTRRYNDMIKNVFMEFGDYSHEYEVEKRSWESGDGV